MAIGMLGMKILSAFLILLMTLTAGGYPFFKRIKTNQNHDFPVGEALACGVFLGAGLLHMLSDSASEFSELGFHYPIAFLLSAIMFLFLLWLEHLSRDFYAHQGSQSPAFALLAVLMLSIHALLAGAALGLSSNLTIFFVILFAILAHKWAESFALAVQINKSDLKIKSGVIYFAIFSTMTPLGIFLGSSVQASMGSFPLLSPIFTALASGTFLYLGTLHGLAKAVMIKECCNLKHFTFVIIGFSIMAVVAVWT
jgi:zinc transporter 1/2/3